MGNHYHHQAVRENPTGINHKILTKGTNNLNYEFHTSPEFLELIENPESQKSISFIKMQAIREKSIPYNACCLKSPQNIHETVKGLFHLADREMMVVMSLDSRKNL